MKVAEREYLHQGIWRCAVYNISGIEDLYTIEPDFVYAIGLP
jgi:hypothetical protein